MINLEFRAHRGFLRSDTPDPQKLFAMLKMLPESKMSQTRAPIAFALVIDTSGSMREFADQERAQSEVGKRGLSWQHQQNADGAGMSVNLQLPTKLDQAVQAAHSLIDDSRITREDRISVVQFDSDASTLLALTNVGDKTEAHRAVDSLHKYSGGTHMSKGMACAQQQLSRLPSEVAKRLILLTDGNTVDDSTCRRVAAQLAEANTPIIAIGVGEEYNEVLMREISDVSQGRPYHLQNMAQLQEILESEVGSAASEVLTDLRASLAAVKGVVLDSVTRVYPSLAEIAVGQSPYRLGNVASGDYTVFVFEMTVSGISRPPSRARLAALSLEGNVQGANQAKALPVQELYTSFTTNEASISEVDAEVLGYVQQKNVDRMVQDGVRLATIDASRARQTLQVAKGMTQRVGNVAMTRMLDNALDELDKTGSISPGTRKTVSLGGRTKTVKTAGGSSLAGAPSEEEIRRLTNS